MSTEFFQTRMGQEFYDGTMRRIADALEHIAEALPKLAAEASWHAREREAGDADAAELLHIMAVHLDQREWTVDVLDEFANLLRGAGYTIRDPNEEEPGGSA